MPGAARLGDKAQVDSDAHGCPSCPHPAVGPIVVGSPDVFVNKLPSARKDDLGIHAVCCGANNFSITKGSPTVYVNNKPMARLNDKTKHCGGSGPIIDGSSDVLIDDGAADAGILDQILAEAREIAREVADAIEKGKAKKLSDSHAASSAVHGVKAAAAAAAARAVAGAQEDLSSDAPKPKDAFVIAAAIKAIGDTALANHKVRILDAETGEQIGPIQITDDDGVIRAHVREKKKLRIEIVDEVLADAPLPQHGDSPLAVLVAHLVDEAGHALANQKIEASAGDDKFELLTDEQGRIEAAAHLGPFELKFKDQTFQAHSVLHSDHKKKPRPYRFSVKGVHAAPPPADDGHPGEEIEDEAPKEENRLDDGGSDE